MYEKEFHSLHNAQIPLPIKFKKYNLAFSAFFWVFTVHSDCHSSKKFTTLASPVLLYKRIFAYCVFETSKQQKALYSCEFRWFYVGSMQKVDMSSFVSQKRCLWYPGIGWEVPSRHTNRKKCLKQTAWISYKDSDKLPSAYHEMWHAEQTHQTVESQETVKKTKSSKCSKLKENFIHIDCFEVQIMVENPLPAFSTTINLLKRKNDQASMKKSLLPLLFPFFPQIQAFSGVQ